MKERLATVSTHKQTACVLVCAIIATTAFWLLPVTATYVDTNAYHVLLVPLRNEVVYQNTQVGDLNSDGLDDVVLTGHQSLEVVLQNSSGNFDLRPAVFRGETYGRFVLADLNGDSSLDICCRNSSSVLVLAFNDGNGNFTNTTTIGMSTGTIKDIVAFHPMNLTTSMLVVTTVGGLGERALALLSIDGLGSVHLEATTSLAEWPVDVSVADFNGDTRDEIAAMDSRGNLSMVAWNGSSFSVGSVDASGPVGAFDSGWLLPVRLNADPYCDLVFVTDTGPGRPGSIAFFLSTGASFSETPSVKSLSGPSLGAGCADLDHDGDSDILLTQLGGETLAIENDMNGAPSRYMVLPSTVLPHAPIALKLAGSGHPSVAVLSERYYGENWMQIVVFSRDNGILSEAIPLSSQYLNNLPLLIGQWATVFVWVFFVVMVFRGRLWR